MTDLGVEIGDLTSAAQVIAATAAGFGAAGAQVRSMEQPIGSTGAATALVARTLSALTDALDRAEGGLQRTGDQLTATADAYVRTEQVLSAWRVPGLGSGGGGS